MSLYYATHFVVDGIIQCGTGRKSVRPQKTTNPLAVDCGCCQRTLAYKAARKAAIEAREAHRAEMVSAGFDPDKPVADMTPEEVKAFVAWRKARKTTSYTPHDLTLGARIKYGDQDVTVVSLDGSDPHVGGTRVNLSNGVRTTLAMDPRYVGHYLA